MHKVRFLFTNRPKDVILYLCNEKGIVFILKLSIISNTGE